MDNCIPEKLTSLDFSVNNQLNDEDIVLEGPRKSLSKTKSEHHQHLEILGIRSFYCAVAQYLIYRLPFDNKLLKSLSCLNPVRRFDHNSVSVV